MNNIGKYLIYFIGILPIFVYRGFLFPHIFTKVVVFETVMLVLFLVCIVSLIKSGLNFPKKNYLFNLWILFILILFLAGIFGQNFYRSLVGDFERMDSLILFIFLSLYFLFLLFFLKTERDWFVFFVVNLIVGSLISVITLLDRFSIITSILIKQNVDRVEGTLGNAGLFATYLLFLIFVSCLLFVWDRNKNRRIFYSVVFFINLITLFLTQTRAGILGFFVGVFVFLAILFFVKNHNIKTKIVVLISAILLFLGMFFIFDGMNFVNKFYSIKDASINNRILTWQSAIEGFKDKPILGYGLENQKYVFSKYYNANNTEQWFDKAHNNYLDILLTSGILGFFVYLLIIFVVFFILFKSVLKKDFYLGALLISFFVAYLVQNFFIFDSIISYVFIISIFAFISFLKCENYFLIKIDNKILKILIVGISIIFFIFVFNIVIVRPVRVSSLAVKANNVFNQDKESSYKFYVKAFSYNIYGNRKLSIIFADQVRFFIADEKLDLLLREKFYNLGKVSLQEVVKNEPDDLQPILVLSLINQYYNKDREFLKEITNYIENRTYLSPDRLEMYYSLAQSYLLFDDYKTSLDYLWKSQSIKQNEEKYYQMAFIASKAQDKNEIKKILIEYGNNFSKPSLEFLKKFSNLLLDNQMYEDSIFLVQSIIEKEPNSLENYLLLAIVYKKSNYMEEFKKTVDFINQVAPNDPDIQKFIKNIK